LSAAGQSGAISLWEVATGRQLSGMALPIPQTAWATALSFSPDDKLLASADSNAMGIDTRNDWDVSVRLWEVATGKEVRRLRGHRGHVWATAFSPDGTTLLAACADGTVRLWEVATGTLLRGMQGHQDDVFAAVFSPDGRRIATASADTTVVVWDVAALKDRRPWPAARLTPEDLQVLWVGLGAEGQWRQAVRRLIALP